jgi:hypothetical protein
MKKLSSNLIFQGAALIAQYGNQALGIVPPNVQPYVALAIGCAQALAAWRAHYFNPDGTPARAPYIPSK